MYNSGFGLYRERNHKNEILLEHNKTVLESGLSHGDMLYLSPRNNVQLWGGPSTSTATPDISKGFNFSSIVYFILYFNNALIVFNIRIRTNGCYRNYKSY